MSYLVDSQINFLTSGVSKIIKAIWDEINKNTL